MLKGFNPKEIKANAAEIIKAGAALYDALGLEPELRELRARAVAGHVDTDFVERSIQEAINQVRCERKGMLLHFAHCERPGRGVMACRLGGRGELGEQASPCDGAHCLFCMGT